MTNYKFSKRCLKQQGFYKKPVRTAIKSILSAAGKKWADYQATKQKARDDKRFKARIERMKRRS